MRAKGFQLIGVLAIVGFLFVLFVALQSALRGHRHRLSARKHEVAAKWLAISGADLAESRLEKGSMRAGDILKSPQFQQGRFEVKIVAENGRRVVVATGFAADKSVKVTRIVGQAR